MHAEALYLMTSMLDQHKPESGGMELLDVGSFDVNGNYRAVAEANGYHYTGLDMMAGKNVDIVSPPYCFPIDNNAYDVVISGSTLEHVERPWLLLPEMARVLKHGGLMVIITHHSFPIHRYPVDCWRFLPDGMNVLLDEAKCLERYEVGIGSPYDIVAMAYKVRL